jgi:hypothetical protein
LSFADYPKVVIDISSPSEDATSDVMRSSKGRTFINDVRDVSVKPVKSNQSVPNGMILFSLLFSVWNFACEM